MERWLRHSEALYCSQEYKDHSFIGNVKSSGGEHRFVARNSLRLDMEKRGVRRSSEEHNLLGFKCNNKGFIETNIKGGFGIASDWPQLNKLAGKLSLTFENVEVEELMDGGNAVLLYENGDVICYGSNKALRKKLTLQQFKTELSGDFDRSTKH